MIVRIKPWEEILKMRCQRGVTPIKNDCIEIIVPEGTGRYYFVSTMSKYCNKEINLERYDQTGGWFKSFYYHKCTFQEMNRNNANS